MDLRAFVATMPWLKKLWDRIPRRLRFPLLVLAAVVWLWRRVRGKGTDDAAERDAEISAPTGGEGSPVD